MDIREFSSKNVPKDVKKKVLEAGRLTGSAMNSQHWRFVLIEGDDHLRKLAVDSLTGAWVKDSNFAVIVLTNPRYHVHLIDAGRAIQDMQLAAWSFGVISCIYTEVRDEGLRKNFDIPKEMNPSAIAAFGYPVRKVSGKKKNRKSLAEIAFLNRYGTAVRFP